MCKPRHQAGCLHAVLLPYEIQRILGVVADILGIDLTVIRLQIVYLFHIGNIGEGDLIHLLGHAADLTVRKRCHDTAYFFGIRIIGIPNAFHLHVAQGIADQRILYGIGDGGRIVDILHGKLRKACHKPFGKHVIRSALLITLFVPSDLTLVIRKVLDHVTVRIHGYKLGNITERKTVDRIVQISNLGGCKLCHNGIDLISFGIQPLTRYRVLLVSEDRRDLDVVDSVIDLIARQPIDRQIRKFGNEAFLLGQHDVLIQRAADLVGIALILVLHRTEDLAKRNIV